MRTARARLAVAFSCAFLGLAAGCADDPPERAGTVSSDETSKETADEEAAGPDGAKDPVTDDNARRVLSDKEAKGALPGVAQMPSGWSVDPDNTLGDDEDDSDDDDDDDTTTPAKCQELFDTLDQANEDDPVGNASVTFTQGGFGPFLGVDISSFEDDVNDESLGRALDTLGECPKFTVDTHDGEAPTTYTVSPLSFANVGEETAAFRMTFESEGMGVALDFAVVRVGHNLVTGSTAAIGGGTVDATVLENQMRGTLKRLSNE
jgi:hypothetical protein